MQEGLRELSVELSLDSLPTLSRRICIPRASENRVILPSLESTYSAHATDPVHLIDPFAFPPLAADNPPRHNGFILCRGM